ncbi:hypothetical protein E4P24_05290 [Haloferax sp. AS1]|uniref:hypothetical protein n=1 Tax=Haloferax sp. AS1 TaxID=2562277 RepID=UPI00165FD260|nr:hypothetical protein [Haloferax sp. AS1]
MNDAVRQRFAVVLALVGVALHVTALAANPSQGFVTEGFAVLLLAVAVGGAPVARDLLAADVAPAESPDADEQR